MGFVRDLRQNRFVYLLMLPGFLFLIVFAYVPMAGHLIAFKKLSMAKGLWNSPWVGFDNFKFFFMGQDWIKVTLNTIFLNMLFICFSLAISLFIAIFLNEIRGAALRRTAQSMIFLPYFVSWMIVSMMLYSLLNTSDGLLNGLLKGWGMSPVSWYSKPDVWPIVLTLTYVWKTVGYTSVILMSTLSGLSPEYYESARMDGASRAQQIRYITVPLLRPVLLVLLLLAVGRIFYGDFGMIYAIVGDNAALFATTDVIDTYSFRALRTIGNFGMASSVVLYQSVLGLATILIFNGIARKYDKDASLF
ncbi:ABC transporter permease subunit [Cohnella sp. GCM10020058]|uniref:ABC transporter permease subunit n=1 Tax=Cohnella sp. GCM10020058 TaxID=3317330 RepID=UPI003642F2D8